MSASYHRQILKFPSAIISSRYFASMAFALLATASQANPYTGVILVTPEGESSTLEAVSGNYSSELKSAVESMKFDFSSIDSSNGLPAGVTSTPAIIFQNERGRSVFQGRYADLGKVRHFITTSRSIPQGDELLTYENAFVREMERTKIAGNIKITDVNGKTLSEQSVENFRNNAMAGIAEGLSEYEKTATVSLQRTDRVFYFDFYPYVDESDQLFVGTALFSLFNCHVPVAEYMGDPVTGPLEDAQDVFRRAAERLAKDLENVRLNSEIGDDFEPVAASVAVVSWDDLGFALPENTGGKDYANLDATVPKTTYTLDPENTFDGAIQFAFPAPLDRYQGSASPATATLDLSGENASGSIMVPVKSVTLGESDLDYHVQNNVLVSNVMKESSFRLEKFDSLPKDMKFGQAYQTVAHGTFILKKKETPLSVLVEMTPILVGDADDLESNTRILATASWEIRLSDPFGIEGPDGPAPAKDTVKFLANLALKPVVESGN